MRRLGVTSSNETTPQAVTVLEHVTCKQLDRCEGAGYFPSKEETQGSNPRQRVFGLAVV